MKYLFAALLAVALVSPARAAIEYIGGVSGQTNDSSATSDALDTTDATLLVAVVTKFGSGAGTLADSETNTWTPLTEYTNAGNIKLRMYWCAAPTTDASHTFSYTGTTIYPCVAVLAFKGTHASPADLENGGGSGTAATSAQPGSVTPSEDNCVVVAAWTLSSTSTGPSIDSGFSTPLTEAGNAGVNQPTAISYKIQTTAGAENPTWSWTTSRTYALGIASFKPAVSSIAHDPIIAPGISTAGGSDPIITGN